MNTNLFRDITLTNELKKGGLCFLVFFLNLFYSFSFAQQQTPQVYFNGQGNGGSNLNIKQSSSLGSSSITSLATNWRAGVDGIVPSTESYGSALWARVCLPSTNGALRYGYMLYGQFYLRIHEENKYARVTTSLNIRVAAGASSANVKISGSNALYGPNSIVALTGNSSTVSGTVWYEIYLPNNCSQKKGYVSGSYLNIASPESYSIVAGTVQNSSGVSLWGANITIGSASTISTEGFYQYKLPKNASRIITSSHVSYNTSSPTQYSHTASNHNYTRNFVLSNSGACSAPTTQAKSLTFTDVSTNQLTVGWTNGNGLGRIVVAKAGSAVNGTPSANTTYTGNSNFGSGSTISSGEYVVYRGTGSGTVSVSGLNPSTTYHFRVFEYNCTSPQYLTSSASGNPASRTTNSSSAQAPVADFYADLNNIKPSTLVSFTDNSSRSPNSWKWSFPGGTPSSSTLQNPSVIYSKVGTHSVKLESSNANGSNAKEIKGYITVSSNATNQFVPKEINDDGTRGQIVADPIHLSTGSYHYSRTDLKMPVVNGMLAFTRYYNSIAAASDGPLGYGWSHSYNYKIINQQDTIWNVAYPDGHISSFIPLYNGGGQSFPLFSGTTDSLRKQNDNSFILYSTDNLRYFFAADGKLQKIVDLNNNTTNLSYSGSNLSSITGQGGRAITLVYNGSNKIVSITDPLIRSCSFAYDASGNLREAKDARQNPTYFTYDGNHRILTVTNPLAQIFLKNEYDANGRVVIQKDVNDKITRFEYNTPAAGDATITYPDNSKMIVHHDAFFRKTLIKDELGFTKSYTYDEHSNETGFTDENGKAKTSQYDKYGNLLVSNQANNGTITVKYNSLNAPVEINDARSNKTTLTYNEQNKLVAIALPDDSDQKFTYTPAGLRDKFTDGRNYNTSYSYSANGDLLTSVSPVGTRTYGYDAAGRVITINDENTRTTSFTYDNNDNITLIRDPLNRSIEFGYDANNQLTSVKDKRGNTSTFEFDNKGRLVKKTDAGGFSTRYGYDDRDNLVSVTDPNNRVVSYTYDLKQRRKTRTDGLGTMNYDYDGVGNLTKVTDASGKTTEFTYSATNKVSAIKDGLGHSSGFVYDLNDNLSSVSDQLNRTTSYSYDPLNRLNKVLDAANETTLVTYDENGNKSSVSDPKGNTQHFSYDEGNRLTSHTDAAGNLYSYTYDPAGNNTKITKPTGTITKVFDELNRVKNAVNSSGDNYEFTYDENDNMRTMRNNLGTSNMAYTKLNQLETYTDPFNKKIVFAYDESSRKKSIAYPGDNTVSYTYDNSGNLKSVKDWQNQTFTYTYDNAGRLKQLLYPNGIKCEYTFDDAGRLIMKRNFTDSKVITSSQFTLDKTGNRVSEVRSGPIPANLPSYVRSYTYGNDDRLISDSLRNYTHDDSGNRLSESRNGKTSAYTFSVDNLLTKLVDTAQVNSQYSYNPLGNRLTKSTGAEVLRYVQDISGALSQVLQITDGLGVVKSQYIYGLGLLAQVDSAGKSTYYHYDAQHNTAALSDADAVIKDTYVYDPFGTLLDHSGVSAQPFTFLGEYGVEQEMGGRYFVRARYYDAMGGRFMSKDPFETNYANPQEINRYIYSTNNPLTWYDYTGLYKSEDSDQTNNYQEIWQYLGNPYPDEVGSFANDIAAKLLESAPSGTIIPIVGKISKVVGSAYTVIEAIKISEASFTFTRKAYNNTATGSEWARTLKTIAVTGGGMIAAVTVSTAGAPLIIVAAVGAGFYGVNKGIEYLWDRYKWDDALNKLW